MKIAYVTTYDAADPTKWSGTGHYIARALESAGCRMQYIGNLKEARPLYFKAMRVLYARLGRCAFQREREPAVLEYYARQVEARLAGSDAQIVFSPGSIPVAHLRTNLPIVIWSDATYPVINREYRWELPPCKRSFRNGMAQDIETMRRAAMMIFSSQWAADSAIHDCGVEPAKVKVVPFGANISSQRTHEEIERLIALRPVDECRLIFIGTGWQRKGGDLALRIAQRINAAGVKATLSILGRDAPDDLPPFARKVGFIDKRSAAGQRQFDELFGSSHFFLLPARAEAFGIVFCEAASYGVPSLATAVGGIPTIIREGANGCLVAPDQVDALAGRAVEMMRDRTAYEAMARSTFAEYQSRLNWNSIGKTVRTMLEELID